MIDSNINNNNTKDNKISDNGYWQDESIKTNKDDIIKMEDEFK